MARAVEDGVGVRAGKMLYPIFLGQVSSGILTAVTFIIIARILGPSQYGIYTFAIGFYALLNSFQAFGVGGYMAYKLPELLRKKDHEGILRAVSSSYIIALAVCGAFTILGIAISPYVSAAFPNINASTELLMVAASTVVVYIISTMPVNLLLGLSRSGFYASLQVFFQAAQLVLAIGLTLAFGVMGAVSAMLFAYLLGLIPGTVFMYKAISRHIKPRIVLPSLKELKSTIRFVWPMGVTNFLNNGSVYFATVFLGLFVTSSALGNYGSAQKALSLLAMIYGTFGLGLLPIFEAVREFKARLEVNKTYLKIMNFELIAVLPVLAAAAALSVPVLHLLIGGSYQMAPLYFTLIVIGMSTYIFRTYLHYLIISGNHTISIVKVNGISTVIVFVLLFVFVPYLSFAGYGSSVPPILGVIVILYVLSNIIEAYLYMREVRFVFRIKFDMRKVALIYASAAVLGLVIALVYLAMNAYLALHPASLKYAAELAVGSAVAMLLYPMILIAMKGVTRQELQEMRSATRKLGKASRVFDGFFDYTKYIYGIQIFE